MRRPVRIGIGGPVGAGKTSLLIGLLRAMQDKYSMATVTNDIYTKEDAEFVAKSGAIDPDRVIAVETGGCPHTAIREDVSMNTHAIGQLVERFDDLDIVFVESGGDNLAATFSPELVDSHIYLIDVAAGEEIPRKRGPGITKSPLLIINKVDLAPYVGVDLSVMDRDAGRMRPDIPYIFANLRTGEGLDNIVQWIETNVLLEEKNGGSDAINQLQANNA